MSSNPRNGFTILEVMIALVILALVLAALASSQIMGVQLTNGSKGTSDIIRVASSHMEWVSELLLSSVSSFEGLSDDPECQAKSAEQSYYSVNRGCNYEDRVASSGKLDIDGDGSGDIFAGYLQGIDNKGRLADLDLDGSNGPEMFAGYDLDYSGTPDIYVASWILQEQDAFDSPGQDGDYSGPIRITVAALAAYDAVSAIGRLDPLILTKSVSCYDVYWESNGGGEAIYRSTAPPSCPEY